ncbi:myosin heavy chain [Photobacterium aphoticum]|uniref:Myosin heavy chain n=1 Tax=Photobacterium aphoticum TaxID=754436 RepID=A0A090QM86_9GAMM|nr:myosin heavy chain [Photobacterium aphoticum]
MKKINSLRPEFEALAASYQALMRNKNAEEALMQFAMMTQSRIEKETTDVEQEETLLKMKANRTLSLRSERIEKESQQLVLKGQHEALSKQRIRIDGEVQKTQLLVSQYDETYTLEMIIDGHREHLAEKEQALELKQDAVKRQEELNKLNQTISQNEALVLRLQASVDNQKSKLFNQLSEPVWLKLLALNTEVAEANPGYQLTVSQKQVIEAFTDLMLPDTFGYDFLGAKLKAVSADKRESDQSRLEKALVLLDSQRKRAAEINAMDKESRFEQMKTLNALKAEIKKYKSGYRFIVSVQ